MQSCTKNFIHFILICAILCFEWSIQDKVVIQIKPKEVLELRRSAEICSKETGIPANNLRKITESTSDDPASRRFYQCVIYNSGYIDEESSFILDKMMVLHVANGTKEEFIDDIKRCGQIKKENPVETAIATGECLREKYIFTPAPQPQN